MILIYTNISDTILYDGQKPSQILLALQTVYTTGI